MRATAPDGARRMRPKPRACAGSHVRIAAPAFVEAAHPLHFTRCRIERHDGAPGACRRIQHATDHERRRLEIELRTRTQVVCLESPRDFERAEVAGIDLIEWRITMAGKSGAVSTPLARRS